MLFPSDNWSGVHPKIMEAIVRANDGQVPAYGYDPLTADVQKQFNDLFECECVVWFVSTGSAANSLALSQLVPPYGAIFCHEASHIQMDETGTPELFTGGAKLLPIAGDNGKLTPAAIDDQMRYYVPPVPRRVRATALSITQGTESGTVYSVDEVGALCESARGHRLKVHMDGARFANATARLGCRPAEITWQAGVDALSFGATKNGALAAEAIVFFDASLTEEFEWRLKRTAHVLSKGRFIAAQWQALLSDGLWLEIAGHANAMAERLATGLADIPGCEIVWPAEINEVFATFPEGIADAARDAGAQFHPWVYPTDHWQGRLQRLVTSFETSDREVDEFINLVRNLTEKRKS